MTLSNVKAEGGEEVEFGEDANKGREEEGVDKIEEEKLRTWK